GPAQQRREPVEERRLRRQDAVVRLVEREPRRAIHLGDLERAPGARRPFDGAGGAAQALGVAVAGDRPREHDLSALLRDGLERDRGALPGLEAGLLAELAHGGRERLLARLDLALRDAPRSEIATRPDGAAGMHEQDLGAFTARAMEEESGALTAHGPSKRRSG